jgi:RNA polymerase sigma factor (sigma-70 family)
MSMLMVNAFTSAKSDAGAPGNLKAWTEEKLLSAAKRGQKAAFGELCERNAKKIFRLARRITRNREDAEDAVQDSFLNAFVHLNDFDGRSRFSTWLTRIAINSALAKLRKNRRVREVSIKEPDATAEFEPRYETRDTAPNPEESYSQLERKEVVSAAIGGLQPGARSVVEFHKLQELSARETAQILGVSTTAVKSRMFHARAALRKLLSLKSVSRSNWASAGGSQI